MFSKQAMSLFLRRGQNVILQQLRMSRNVPIRNNQSQTDVNYTQKDTSNMSQKMQVNSTKENSSISSKQDSSVGVAQHKMNSIINDGKDMVYCHALPNDWDEKRLIAYFDPNRKNIAEVKLLKNRIGGYTGRALIRFTSSKICEEYLQKYSDHFIETTDVLQRILMKPFELKTKQTRLQVERTMKEVYLANLPYECTSDEIYALAQDFGEVLYVDMPLAFDGTKNRGYCIVKFPKPEQATKFKNYFDNETFYDRKIRAQIYFYEFDTQKKRVERMSNKIIKEDPSINNANLRANKELYKQLMNDNSI